jgi:UDP-N-acetylmuramoyl-L-alanyl-D-glutamate--2,6-diaminopimelate ligase
VIIKKLEKLLIDIPHVVYGRSDLKIKGIAYHSDKVKSGYLFVTLDGFTTSGKKYVDAAINKGAKAIASDSLTILEKINRKYKNKITTIHTSVPRKFLAAIANRFYDFPARKLTLIGITGTDGKTTTSYMIKSIIEATGKKTGLIGTIKYYDGKSYLPATNTTPESLDFITFLYSLVKQQIPYCISEVSSHALALDRVYGIDFKIAIFTNLSKDHLDFHKNIKKYRNAKLQIFQNLSSSAIAILNNDDPFTKQIIKQTNARCLLYSIKQSSNVNVTINKYDKQGIDITIHFPSPYKILSLKIPMIGYHNVYNTLAAVTTAYILNIKNHKIKHGLEQMPGVLGRLQRIQTKRGFDVYIDYAHTAKALTNAINSLKHITLGRVIVVFGCGGNRDCLKRPKMGRCATTLSDYVIITSDNPRNENPRTIINDIKKGLTKNNYEIIVDRKMAIEHAIKLAKPGDSVLIAGKGHEDYQIIRNKKIYFSDYAVARTAIISS